MLNIKIKYQIFIFLFISLLSLKSFAQIQNIDDELMIKTIKSNQDACQKLNEKLLLNVDEVYFFKNCVLHHITDVYLINTLILEQKKTPLKMSSQVYAMLSIGSNYSFDDYYHDFSNEIKKDNASICKNFNNKIVSLDDYHYYLIENCQKRKFTNYYDVQKFNVKNDPIYSILKYQLNQFKAGRDIVIENKIVDIKEPSEETIQKHLPSKAILCKNLNNKITSFFESFYYVDKCILLPISDFNLDLQLKAEELGGILDLSIEQALGLKIGKEISSKEVMKKL